jgi:hypothetical protein
LTCDSVGFVVLFRGDIYNSAGKETNPWSVRNTYT